MKERTKGFIVGILATCTLLGVTATALAAGGTVVFNSVNIRLNGEQVSAKGENFTIGNGQSVPGSILYEDATGGGTTYVPLARLAELLGTPIGWDGNTGSVLIGEKSSAPDPVSTADYSDWTAEQEAAYQEFKGMWDIGYISGSQPVFGVKATLLGSHTVEYAQNLLDTNLVYVERMNQELSNPDKAVTVVQYFVADFEVKSFSVFKAQD